ncbi:hypothetical protein KL943_001050 [Ogataea angusta]|nr:hypothetical protein KL943_001050 [Ogataea angusta]
MSSDFDEKDLHQGIIFAVHLTPTLRSHVPRIMSCVGGLIRDLVKTQPNTGLGCFIFNCSKKDASVDGVLPVFELQDISIDQLQTIEQFDGASVEVLEENPEINCGEQLARMLQVARSNFVAPPRFTKPYTVRRIFLFSDCDRPFNGNTSRKITLWNILGDLSLEKINITPFLLANKPDFDLSEYQTIFETLDQFRPAVEKLDIDQVEDKILRTKELRRTSFRCTLALRDIKMSVQGCPLFKEPRLQSPYRFFDDNGTYRYVESQSVKLDTATGAKVNDDDVVSTVGFENQHATLNRDLISKPFDNENKPVLQIVGFRKIEYFVQHYSVGTPALVTPSDLEQYTHSRRSFSALYQALTAKRKLALAWGSTRKNQAPTSYYLVPTAASLGYSTSIEPYPEGLALIPLPFKDDVRCLPGYLLQMEPSAPIFPNQIEDLVTEIIDIFKPLPNPQIEWYFKVLEDHLLQREVDYNPQVPLEIQKQQMVNKQDQLKKKCMELRNRLGNSKKLSLLVAAVRAELNRMDNFQQLNVEPTREDKKAMLLTDDIVLKAYKLGQLNDFTSDQLKVYVNSKANLIPKAKTKKEMLENITDYLDRTVG